MKPTNNRSIMKLIIVLAILLLLIMCLVKEASAQNFLSEKILVGEQAPYDGRILGESDYKNLIGYYFLYEECEQRARQCCEVDTGVNTWLFIGVSIAAAITAGIIGNEIGRKKDSP